jgi:hypothetical protein
MCMGEKDMSYVFFVISEMCFHIDYMFVYVNKTYVFERGENTMIAN